MIKNTARTHTIKLEKQWVNAVQGDQATLSINGGTGVVSTANGQSGSWVDPTKASATVRAGDKVDFLESLNSLSGALYNWSYSCTPAAVSPGVTLQFSITSMPDTDVICTFTNTGFRGSLTLTKKVTNDNGGDADDKDWTLNAKGIVSLTGKEGDATVTGQSVPVGNYVLTESGGPGGYIQTGVSCSVDGGAFAPLSKNAQGQYVFPVASGHNIVCEFQNDDIAPKLTLKKIVDNKDGIGSHASTEWTLSAAGTGGFSEAASQNVTANSSTTTSHGVRANTPYTLGESTIAGYSASAWSCTPGGTATEGVLQLELPLAADVTCTITNTVKTHTVKLKKAWSNAFTGATADLTVAVGARNQTAKSTVAANPTFTDDVNVATLTVAEGDTVNVSEIVAGTGTYASSLDCGAVTLTKVTDRNQSFTAPTSDVVCTFTNSAERVTMQLTKKWVDSIPNDKAVLNIGGAQPESGTATAPLGGAITKVVRIGDTVSFGETLTGNKGTYDATWDCTGISAPVAGSLSSPSFQVTGPVSCTITNTARKITVTVDKQWVNAFVGDDATLAINGAPGASNADSATETDPAVVTKVVRVGDDVVISETLADGNKGKYDATYKCGTAEFSNRRQRALIQGDSRRHLRDQEHRADAHHHARRSSGSTRSRATRPRCRSTATSIPRR